MTKEIPISDIERILREEYRRLEGEVKEMFELTSTSKSLQAQEFAFEKYKKALSRQNEVFQIAGLIGNAFSENLDLKASGNPIPSETTRQQSE